MDIAEWLEEVPSKMLVQVIECKEIICASEQNPITFRNTCLLFCCPNDTHYVSIII